MRYMKVQIGNQDVFQSKNAFSKLFLELNFTKKMMIGNEKKIYLISLYPIYIIIGQICPRTDESKYISYFEVVYSTDREHF